MDNPLKDRLHFLESRAASSIPIRQLRRDRVRNSCSTRLSSCWPIHSSAMAGLGDKEPELGTKLPKNPSSPGDGAESDEEEFHDARFPAEEEAVS